MMNVKDFYNEILETKWEIEEYQVKVTSFMFVDWKNIVKYPYYLNNLQMQYYPNQKIKEAILRFKQKDPKIHTETLKAWNIWSHNSIRFHDIIQDSIIQTNWYQHKDRPITNGTELEPRN